MALAVIMKMRKHVGLLIGVIAVAIVSFLLMDAINSNQNVFGGGNQQSIGEINGTSLNFTEFNNLDQEMVKRFKYFQGYGGQNFSFTEEQRYQIRDYAWDEFTTEKILMDERKSLDLIITKEEVEKNIFSPNPSNEARTFFSLVIDNTPNAPYDPDKMRQAANEIQNIPPDDIERYWIREFYYELQKVIQSTLQKQKYANLFAKSNFVPDWKAQLGFAQRNNKADISVVTMLFDDIPDEEMKPTEEEIQAYFENHKNEYLSEEPARGLEYVIFDILPTKKDSVVALDFVNEKWQNILENGKDSLIITRFSETPFYSGYFPKGEIQTIMEDTLFVVDSGTQIGPYIEEGKYRYLKLIDRKVFPDSVKSRHVLISLEKYGIIDTVRMKMDSVKALYDQGVPFDTLVAKYSDDQNTVPAGGDLGYIRPASQGLPGIFFRALFEEHKLGDVFTLESAAGMHLIEITEVGKPKMMVKYEILDNSIEAGTETRDSMFTVASRFYTTYALADSFDSGLEKLGMAPRFADNLKSNDYNIPGINMPARNLVKWAFDEGTKLNDVKLVDEFEGQDNKYLIVKVIKKVEAGESNLEAFKERITEKVIEEKKKSLLADKMKNAAIGANSLDQIAAKLGTEVINAKGLTFTSQFIEGVGVEPNVTATASALALNTLSDVIDGSSGVFIISKTNETIAETPADLSILRSQLAGALQQQFGLNIIDQIKSGAEIEDNRYKYY
jgi:peptidyl-prolyl cis-trans isomerase D